MLFDKKYQNQYETSIHDEIMDKMPVELRKNPQVMQELKNRIHSHTEQVARYLMDKNPWRDWQVVLQKFELALNKPSIELPTLEDATTHYLDFTKSANVPATADYWHKGINAIKTADYKPKKKSRGKKSWGKTKPKRKRSTEIRLLYKQLMEEWRKSIDEEIRRWQAQQMAKLRAEFIQSLQEWFVCLQQICAFVNDLGMDLGYFLDFADGGASLTDIQTLKDWLQTLEEDTGVKKICDLLGRLKRMGKSMEMQMIETPEIATKWVPDCNSTEEITGIELGNTIERVIPSELALLASPDIDILFDLKYIESKLMCFEMIGYESVETTTMQKKRTAVETEEPKGPIIICVDTSASMQGTPEYIAKAATLHMVNLARQEKRDCYLINFSTGIETLDFSAGMAFSDFLGFLQQSFHGGTDATPALEHAIEQMNGEKYGNADLIIISDFIMPQLQQSLQKDIQKLRKKGNKFHSLCITGEFVSERLKTHFDQEWVYNPATSEVSEIINFSKTV